MSTYSFPSSPESVSDEDNHPKARPWWEAPPKPPKRGRRQGRVRRTARVKEVDSFVHNPDPDEAALSDDEAISRHLDILEKLEAKEIAAEEKKERAAESARSRSVWDRAEKRLQDYVLQHRRTSTTAEKRPRVAAASASAPPPPPME